MEKTAVEWLVDELKKFHHPTEAMIMYAKKLEKQQQNNISAQRYIDGYNKAKKNLYTKEDVLKAGEIGEINHHDYKHIVSLLNEARKLNKKRLSR